MTQLYHGAQLPTAEARGRVIRPAQGVLPPPPADELAGRTTTPLTGLFPECRTITGGFRQIDIPSGITAAAGTSAWYPLVNMRPTDVYGGDGVVLFGVDIEFASTDNADAAAVDAGHTDWGSAKGMGAAIVVGSNLPIANGAWTIAPCNVPGAQDSGTIALVEANQTAYYFAATFPMGSWNDAIPFKSRLTKSWAPYGFRIKLESELQVALVIDGPQIETGSTNTTDVYGLANVQLNIGLTRAIDAWN